MTWKVDLGTFFVDFWPVKKPQKSTLWAWFFCCFWFLACGGLKSMFRVDFVEFLGLSRPKNKLLELILLIFGPVEAKKKLVLLMFWACRRPLNFLSWFCWFLGLSRTQKSIFWVDFVDLGFFLLIFGPVEAKKSTFWVDFVDFCACRGLKNQLFELILLIFGLGPPKKSTFWVDLVDFWVGAPQKINFLSWFCFWALFVDFWACRGLKNQFFELIVLIFGLGPPRFLAWLG